MATIYIETDHTATFKGLADQDGNPVTGATVTATLLDKNSVVLDPQLEPFPLTFTDAGGGDYVTAIPHDHDLKEGTPYKGRYKAVIGAIQREWDGPLDIKRGTI